MSKIAALLLIALTAAFSPAQAQQAPKWALCGESVLSPKIVIAACTVMILLNPKNVSAYNNRGTTYASVGQFDLAIEDYTRAIQLNSQDGFLFNNRGLTYSRKREFDRAIEDYTQAIKLNSQDARPFNNRGRAFANKGQIDRAIEDFSQAIALDPKYVSPWLNRGTTYASQGQRDRAIQDYDQVIRLDSKNVYAWMNRCRSRAILGTELREALEDCNEALRLNPPKDLYAGALEDRALIYLKLNQFDDAIAACNTILAANPNDAFALYGRGYVKRKNGDGPGGDSDIAAAKALERDIAEQFEKLGVK